jgi:hypothetical protein
VSARARRPSTSPRSCAARTCVTACRGTRWRCWSGPAGRRSRPDRALTAAGVPVEVGGGRDPLAANPAVRPLLLALQVAARGCAVTPDEAQVLLSSPLGGMDSMAVRRLGRTCARRSGPSWPGPPCPGRRSS